MTPLWLAHARPRPWRIIGGAVLFAAWWVIMAMALMMIAGIIA